MESADSQVNDVVDDSARVGDECGRTTLASGDKW